MFDTVIINDRYGGAYSNGEWVAVADASKLVDGRSRLYIAMDGVMGGDTNAMTFWADEPEWVAVGDTPDEAYANLRKKLGLPSA